MKRNEIKKSIQNNITNNNNNNSNNTINVNLLTMVNKTFKIKRFC